VAQYENLPINHRVQIEEDSSTFKNTPYQSAPSPRGSTAPILTAPPLPATVSTWLIAPLFGPDLQLADLSGNVHQLSALKGRPVVLTFIRAGCGESQKQLEQLQQGSASLATAGLSVFAVAVTFGDDRAAIANLARSAQLDFPLHLADEHAAGAWNIQYRYLFDRRRDMPLPISLLLDESGAMIRIYQGIATPREVVADWNSAAATADARLARAMPFPGPYYGAGMRHDYLTYGIAFTEYGYVDEAQAAFQHAIDADPSHEIAWFNLGTIYLNKKMYPEARKCLAEAVRLNPQDSDAWNNLGSISGTEEKYDEALDEFRHAALANPNHLVATENMMRIYRFQGRAADAQKTLEELIAHSPEIADLHLALAMTLVAQNDLARARSELETSIRLRPDNPEAINNLGAVLQRMGLAGEALARFEECHRLAPDFDRPVINAALIYNTEGRPTNARKVLEEFLTRHPDNADVRSALEKMGAQ
jgi:tetratricopeptide (TPR) repeat protein